MYVMTEAHQKLYRLYALQNRINMLLFIYSTVGAVNHYDKLNKFVLDSLAEGILVFAGEILGRYHRPQQSVIGLLIDRKMLVLRHDPAHFVIYDSRNFP